MPVKHAERVRYDIPAGARYLFRRLLPCFVRNFVQSKRARVLISTRARVLASTLLTVKKCKIQSVIDTINSLSADDLFLFDLCTPGSPTSYYAPRNIQHPEVDLNLRLPVCTYRMQDLCT